MRHEAFAKRAVATAIEADGAVYCETDPENVANGRVVTSLSRWRSPADNLSQRLRATPTATGELSGVRQRPNRTERSGVAQVRPGADEADP